MVSNTSIFDDERTDDVFRRARAESPVVPVKQSRLAVIASSALQSAIGPTLIAASVAMFSGSDCVAASSSQLHNSVVTVAATSHVSTKARWWERVEQKLANYRLMRAGWEPGALSISTVAIDAILSFMEIATSPSTPAPAVVPLVDGGIQVEWHFAGLDIEVAADSAGRLRARFGAVDGDDFEEEISEQSDDLTGWVDRLLAV